MKTSVSTNFLSKLLDACSHFIYPSHCLHCHEMLLAKKKHLCDICFDSLAYLNPLEHCPICFAFTEGPICDACLSNPLAYFFDGSAAAFSYESAAASLIKAIKYGNQSYLADGMGAMMSLQFHQLKSWPVPDLIVPVPIAWDRRLSRGFNQSLLLSESLAKFVQIPVIPVLKRTFGDYSQAGLSNEQRLQLNEKKSFYLKNNSNIYDKTILLVDDVMTTATTVNACARALLEGSPNKIYVLTACKAL